MIASGFLLVASKNEQCLVDSGCCAQLALVHGVVRRYASQNKFECVFDVLSILLAERIH